MLGRSPMDLVIVEHRVKTTAVGGGPGADNDVGNILGHQSLYAAYGKIHIKDKNLISLENVPELIYRGDCIGPLSVWTEA